MASLEELMAKHGVEVTAQPNSSVRGKLLHQVNRMLSELSKYKTEEELNGASVKYWWSNKSNNGQRLVAMRYDNKVVANTSGYVDNTLSAVQERLEVFKKIIEDSTEDTWADETERRKKK